YDRLVTLNMTGLRPHKSDGGGAGWWTGFSVVAPEKAAGVVAEYSSDGVNYGRPVNAALKEGLYSHYFDAVRWVHYYVRLNWIGPELTEAETAPVTYKLDFTGVQADVSGLTLPDSPMGTLGVAALSDWTEGETRREQLFDSYGLKVYAKRDEKGGYLELVITAEGLVSHLSGGGRGYWAGFSAAAPAGTLSCRYVAYRGMEAAKQSFASAPLIPREGFYQNVNGFGAAGILQKSDAALSGQRDYWTVLQWYSDAEGRVPLTAPEVYYIVIDATFA
ncbi:MAG: hypothetical protein IJ705_02015, partial [Oscillospiraceae bacterium]|nr:hypothetical protein [Oscillospiraceae bacterium]